MHLFQPGSSSDTDADREIHAASLCTAVVQEEKKKEKENRHPAVTDADYSSSSHCKTIDLTKGSSDIEMDCEINAARFDVVLAQVVQEKEKGKHNLTVTGADAFSSRRETINLTKGSFDIKMDWEIDAAMFDAVVAQAVHQKEKEKEKENRGPAFGADDSGFFEPKSVHPE